MCPRWSSKHVTMNETPNKKNDKLYRVQEKVLAQVKVLAQETKQQRQQHEQIEHLGSFAYFTTGKRVNVSMGRRDELQLR